MERLKGGLKSFGITISEKQVRAFQLYADELIKWNKKINLTSIVDRDEIIEKHFIDSLAILPALPPSASVLDVGSGAGFPGIPIAVVRPTLSILCIDSIGKKVNFINNIVYLLKLKNAKALQARLDKNDCPSLSGKKFDCIVSRGTFRTTDLICEALPYLSKKGYFVLMKGRDADTDIDQDIFTVETKKYSLPFSHADRSLLIISKKVPE